MKTVKIFLYHKLLWVAALGYAVDLYDVVLYGVIRIPSLTSLGLNSDQITQIGAILLNLQMGGMIAGGLFFGILGDRLGRKSALFGSILLYSIATFLNGYVNDVWSYGLCRFIAGFGLAGELGAAVTLTSEVLPQHLRGLGAAFIACFGFVGAAVSSQVNQIMDWRHAYMFGGAMGIGLLFLRMSVNESPLHKKVKDKVSLETLKRLFRNPSRRSKIFLVFLVGVPIWYVAGILSYFAPEFAKAFEIQGTVTAGQTIFVGYLGAILGDILCGVFSQILKSRKKAVIASLLLASAIAIFHPLFLRNASPEAFYITRFIIGITNGYMAILVVWIAEIFGTNLRATTTILLSNLVRAAVIPISFAFGILNPRYGLVPSAISIAVFIYAFAIFSAWRLPETFHADLDFEE